MGFLTSFLTTTIHALTTIATYEVLQFAWTHAQAQTQGDLGLLRYLHATKGKPAWALVTNADTPIGRALCHEFAARGFNVVMHGADRLVLGTMKKALEGEFPWNRYRVVVGHGGGGEADRVLVARVADAMREDNLTVLVNNGVAAAGSERGVAFATQLIGELVPLLRRNAPSLVANIGSFADLEPKAMPLCVSCGASTRFGTLNTEGELDVVTYCLGDCAVGNERPSFLRPGSDTLACAVLRHAGSGGKGGNFSIGAIIPYWPHDLLRTARGLLPSWVLGLGWRDVGEGQRKEAESVR